MKISFKWLKNYLDFQLTPERISEILTDTGLEIEGLHSFEEIQGGLEGIVIGEVMSCEPHPDADRLKVTTVNLGDEIVQIVCGAPNVRKGIKVVVSKVGATLYPKGEKPFKIKKAKIRGVESVGMICAEDEIGLGVAHEGIIILPDSAKVGLEASHYFEIYRDHQLEIGLTPNRCDAMGHIGVARDLKAFLNFHENANLEIKLPESVIKTGTTSQNKGIKINIENPELCPRYIGAVLDNVVVEPSPKWLKNHLKSIGLEPINNVVDVTNFVMFEFGTPMHAFDRNAIQNDISIKNAIKGTEFETLDGEKRKLTGSELMITSGGENLCMAGVFGGLHSGVSNKTTSIFLESAIFNATSIRKTSKAHALQTDASFRFERGVDPTFTEKAMLRAISLIQELTGARLAMEPVIIDHVDKTSKNISFSTTFLNNRLGTQLLTSEICKILSNLDFKCENTLGENIEVTVPQYRIDVTRAEDVLEEVLRIYGFNKVALPKKWHISFPVEDGKNEENIQRTTSELFVSQGFNEVLNNSLRKNDLGDDEKTSVAILNPLSKELATMRKSLFFGLLETIEYNQNRQQVEQRIFEFGKSYFKTNDKYVETRELAFAISGKVNDQSWQYKTRNLDFFDLKQSCDNLMTKLGIKKKLIEGANIDGLFERSYAYTVGKDSLIEFGQVNTAHCKKAGVKSKTFIAIANWDLLLKYSNAKTIFKELPKTFFVRRDFSLILDENVEYASIENEGYKANKKLLKDINLFDVYEGDKLPKGKKSYAVSFIFQDNDSTLQDSTIDPIMKDIRKKLEENLGAELRG
jgi:phenylalanyl-tRNA synthetase beta chain